MKSIYFVVPKTVWESKPSTYDSGRLGSYHETLNAYDNLENALAAARRSAANTFGQSYFVLEGTLVEALSPEPTAIPVRSIMGELAAEEPAEAEREAA